MRQLRLLVAALAAAAALLSPAAATTAEGRVAGVPVTADRCRRSRSA